MIPKRWMVWLLLLSFAPAILLSLRHTPWVVWVIPIFLTYVFKRQWNWEESPPIVEQEEPPDFCFSLLTKQERELSTTRERWQTTLIRWRTAILALPEGVLLLDFRFALCWFNPEAQHLLGLYHKRDIGVPITYRISKPILDEYIFRGDFNKTIDLPSPVNGGQMLNFCFIFLEKENFWLVLVRDITEQYQLDRQQRDFLANISHELKTPLTVFRGVLEILPELDQGSCQWDHALSLLQKQTDRMQTLIEDQTTLLRLGPVHHDYPVEPLLMKPFLQDMVAAAEVLSGPRRHEFQLSVDTSFPFEGNAELLRCVVNNLLSNAVHHTPAQTEVRVIWNQDDFGRPTLIVSDNGPGIASYHLPRLTEKYYRVTFQQTASSNPVNYQGSGLGLALVKQAMERCDGKLEIISQLGLGSRFICRFPGVLASVAP